MRRRRTVLPLPRYTRRKWLAASKAWAYYFEPPAWAQNDERGQCPVDDEALGTDYAEAVRRAETVLLPLWDSWRTRGLVDLTPGTAAVGTLDWLFAEYRKTDAFKELDRGVKRLHEYGFSLIGNYVLKDGRRLGAVKLTSIDTGVVDPLYAKLRLVRDTSGNPIPLLDDDGKPAFDEGRQLFLERRTTINHAMKSCRRAWNVVWRLHKNVVPLANPFSKMGLKGSTGSVTEATWIDLQLAIAQADALKMPSLAAALMVTWEWLQREEHIFTQFKLDHYRPKSRPNEVLVVHPKSGDEQWVPLFDATGAALFPELMARMDALKRDRVGNGLFFVRDWLDRNAGRPLPWVTQSGDLTYVRKKTKAIVRAAELRDELSFTSFRHGGFTECGDAEITDAGIRALSRQKSTKIVSGYVKKTQRQIIENQKKRRAVRPEPAAQGEPEQLSFDMLLEGRRR